MHYFHHCTRQLFAFWSILSPTIVQHLGRFSLLDCCSAGNFIHPSLPWWFPTCRTTTIIHLPAEPGDLPSFVGIPLTPKKIKGPTTSLSFLGIIIDTHHMKIRLPKEKITRIQDTLEKWLIKKRTTKYKIFSAIGQLQHATNVVRCGHTFTSRMYATAEKIKKLHYYIRLNTQFRWLGLVAYLFASLEWLKYPTGFQLFTTHTNYYARWMPQDHGAGCC